MAAKKKSAKAQGNAKGFGKGKMNMMLQMMQSMMGGGGGGDSWGGNSWGGNNAADQGITSKSQLKEALQKSDAHKDAKPTYEVFEVNTGSGIGFQATVDIGGQAFNGEVGASKKAAEQNAAKAALKDLFPGAAKKTAGGKKAKQWPQQGGAGNLMEMLAGASGGKGKGGKGNQKSGQKRKAGGEEEQCVRLRLNEAVQLLIPVKEGAFRLKSKDDVVFQTEQTGSTYTSTVTIKVTGGSFEGEACSSQKDAERSAATAAYSALQDEVAPLIEEHIAKKKAKAMEQRAAYDAKKKAAA